MGRQTHPQALHFPRAVGSLLACLARCLAACFLGSLIACLVCCLAARLLGLLFGCLLVWLTARLLGLLFVCLLVWLTARLLGLLFVCLLVWLTARLLGLLFGCLLGCRKREARRRSAEGTQDGEAREVHGGYTLCKRLESFWDRNGYRAQGTRHVC